MHDLNTDVADWVDNQLRTLGSLASQPSVADKDVSATLARVGSNLFEQLLPKALQDMCWTFRQRGIRRVLILSDEPHIPWELIKPYRTDPVTGELIAEDIFWGEAFALTPGCVADHPCSGSLSTASSQWLRAGQLPLSKGRK